MRRLLPFLLLLIPCAAQAQNARFDDIAFKGTNPSQFAAGATITVCTSSGVGLPCAPTVAGLCSSASDATCNQPASFTADGVGNFGFWIQPGRYVVTVTGSGLAGFSKSITLACQPTATCTVTGRMSLGNVNGTMFFVDDKQAGALYPTIASAVTAAGSTNSIVVIPGNYSGVECGANQTNITYWDMRGANIICSRNSWSFLSNDANGINSLVRTVHTVGNNTGTSLPVTGSPVGIYGETFINGVNFNGSQADGASMDLNFFGTNSGTMPIASGHELAVSVFGTASGNASLGGTITLATGAHGYVTTLAGSTTAITTVAGFNGIGCQSKIFGVVPVNCYGIFGRRQLGAGSSRNYGVVSEGKGLFMYDNNVAAGGFDCEDNGGTARSCLFVDSTGAPGNRGILTLQAVSVDGGSLASSDNASRFAWSSTTINSKVIHRFSSDATPNAAAGAFLGSNALPWAGFSIGTAATNNFTFTPAATAAARTIELIDSDFALGKAMVTSTYTNATTTASNIAGLSFAVLANRNYTMDCSLYYQGSAGTAGLDITVTGPAAATSIFYSYEEDATATTSQNSVAAAFATKLVGAAAVTATTNLPAHVTIGLRNGANAGTVQLQGSATGAGTVTVQAGSACSIQ